MTSLKDELRLLLTAVQFLTRLPVPAWTGHSDAQLARSARHFSGIGALVGAVAGLVAVSANALWSSTVAAALSVSATLWLTGALHEDGLADAADGLLGAHPRERALKIMKDSRIGSHGAAALVIALLLRVNITASLLDGGAVRAVAACIAAHAAARAVAVATMRALPHADQGAGPKSGSVHQVGRGDANFAVVVGIGIVLIASVALLASGLANGPARAPLCAFIGSLFALLVLFAIFVRALRARLGGYTGDTLGAVEQCSEVCVLLAFSAACRL